MVPAFKSSCPGPMPGETGNRLSTTRVMPEVTLSMVVPPMVMMSCPAIIKKALLAYIVVTPLVSTEPFIA